MFLWCSELLLYWFIWIIEYLTSLKDETLIFGLTFIYDKTANIQIKLQKYSCNNESLVSLKSSMPVVQNNFLHLSPIISM